MRHILFNRNRGIKGSGFNDILLELGNSFNDNGKIVYGPEKRFEGAYEMVINVGLCNYEFVIQDLTWCNKTLISYDQTIISGCLFFWINWFQIGNIHKLLNQWIDKSQLGKNFQFLTDTEYQFYRLKSAQQGDAPETRSSE
jgi:hypothetical protein